MIKIFKYFFYSIFLSIFIAITLALIFIPEDQAWIDCSDEKDLYRYVYDGWKVDKVIKDYKGEYPIWLSKTMDKSIEFGWRCYYLEGAELNFKESQHVKGIEPSEKLKLEMYEFYVKVFDSSFDHQKKKNL